MSKCKACRYFDCGEACECVCHSTFKDDVAPKEYPKKLKAWDRANPEGLASLFG